MANQLARTGRNPFSYLGIAPQSVAADVIQNRAPEPEDYINFQLMTRWLNLEDTENPEIFVLVNIDGNSGAWMQIGPVTENVLGDHNIVSTPGVGEFTLSVDNTMTLGDLAPVSGDALLLTTGDVSITAGNLRIANASTIFVGGTPSLRGKGTLNTFVGPLAGNSTLTGSNNTALGNSALGLITSGTHNTAIGTDSGLNYEANTSCVVIGSPGEMADNNTLRIGTPGTHTSAFMSGISGITPSGSCGVVIVNSSGQLGATDVGTAGQVLTGNGPDAAPTFKGGIIPPAAGCSFFAYMEDETAYLTGEGPVGTIATVIFDATKYNLGSAYDTATGIFTAPTTGVYYFLAGVSGLGYDGTGYTPITTQTSLYFPAVNLAIPFSYLKAVASSNPAHNAYREYASMFDTGALLTTGATHYYMSAGDTCYITFQCSLAIASSFKTIRVMGTNTTGPLIGNIFSYFSGMCVT